MGFELPKLSYAKSSLEPYLSEETLEFHHGKHHQTYINTLNNLIIGTEFEDESLEKIICSSSGAILNNAAQVWNHSFYWNCLTPNGGGEPTGELADAISDAFGSFDNFKEEFTKITLNIFGSGWGWLVNNVDGELGLVASTDAGNPMTDSKTPLLACDVWEHAYYLDYRNARPAYLAAFWELVDWDFVTKNFLASQ